MNTRAFVSLVVFALALAATAAESWRPIDVRAFTNFSIFEQRKPGWLLPRGQQVFDGVPFRVDGVIQLAGVDKVAELKTSPKLVKDIPIGGTFDRLHLLAAVAGSNEKEGNTVLRVRFDYENGSNVTMDLNYGDHVRNWGAPLHKSDRALRDANHATLAWAAQSPEDAAEDRYTRLFHITLENPQPASGVRSLALESVNTNCGPLVAAITLGAADAPRMTNTLNLSRALYPDLRKREGESAALSGTVKTPEGVPIAKATVRVLAQRDFSTREWQSSEMSSKTNLATETDAEGRFTLPALPDNKLYHLIAVAPGREATFFNGADPKSAPVDIRLMERKPAADGYKVWIRVVDESGQPIVGAVATKEGVRSGSGTSWGGTEGFSSQGVSDANGEFYFERKTPFTALQMSIKALGFAPNKCWADASKVLQTITLDVGATVRGRVTKEGQPLTNVVVGVSGVDRNSEVFVGRYTATTDTNGVFEFAHLPARKSWWLYGTMSSLQQYGATRPRQFLTAAAGQTNSVDDLEVTHGLRLAGRVQTRSGEPLPDGIFLYVGYDHGDGQNIKVDKAGNFESTGLMPGKLDVNLQRGKWRFSGVNRSLDNWNSFELTGLLREDKDDLLLVIEPGERNYSYNNSNGQLPPADYSGARPLFGAEASGPVPIVLAGQVLDDATGKPVRAFKVVPGRKPPVTTRMAPPPKPLLQQLTGAFRKPTTPWNELPWWDNARIDTFSNGVFSVDFQPLTSTPMFLIEADGYEPFISEPIGTNTTNLVIRLSGGTGPNGVVLQTDGKPAVGAKVWYAVAREQSSLSGRTINSYGEKESLKTTDTNGHFAFMPRPEGRILFVTHTNGWAEQEVKNGAGSLKIQLGAWATVVGTLVSSNGTPMPGVTLHLNLLHDWSSGDPFINTQGRSVTDGMGKFIFTDVTPGRVNLDREVPVNANSWRYQPQTWFICQPGVTNDLGNVTYDSPPPPPFGEKIKKALGL